jgi:elongation factor P--(R)-beta-lysine ligase
MLWFEPAQFQDKVPVLRQRTRLIRAIRDFFIAQDFDEVETPILQTMPCADIHIHAFATELKDYNFQNLRALYLQTSPEFDMKKLLVAGLQNIFQICKVFRNCEGSTRHVAEFTMLEWYRSDRGYEDIMQDCEDLLRFCAKSLKLDFFQYQGCKSDPFASWQKISVLEAYERYAHIDLGLALDHPDQFYVLAKKAGFSVRESQNWDEIFHHIMAEAIEPQLGAPVPTILYDYPAHMAALSNIHDTDSRLAKRFELYVCGLELANAFDELTDAQLQRQRFKEDMAEKERLYGFSYPLDEDFLKALQFGLKPSGGIALGVDRLMMLVANAHKIEDVLWCPHPTAADIRIKG